MSEDDLKNARGNEKPYPSGYFGWKRGQPLTTFDFEFDEKLNAKLKKILEAKE